MQSLTYLWLYTNGRSRIKEKSLSLLTNQLNLWANLIYKRSLIESPFPHCTAYISFWITKRQAISTDTIFEIEMMMKMYAIEIILKFRVAF